jgi:putative tryptophan/tyrosine transport system substrate-binding protein
MQRRDFVTLLGGAAALWPLAAPAQQPGKTPRVGYIRAGTPNNDPFREEFVRGMRDLGYVEGRNITYEFRHYGDDVESIPSLIGDLLRVKVDIIVTGGTAAVRAAQTATQSVPIVIGAAADPLGLGLVAGLARPGGNTTGFSVLSTELTVKRLELLKESCLKRFGSQFSRSRAIRRIRSSSKRSNRSPGCSALPIGISKHEG